MPTYEYACKSCGEHLEVVQSFTADALTTCPACGGPLRKVFGNIGISFKGTGFYKNDSRTAKDGARESGTPAKETASSGDKSSGGGESGGSGESGGAGSKSDAGAKTGSGSDSGGSSSDAGGSGSGSGGAGSSTSKSGRSAAAS